MYRELFVHVVNVDHDDQVADELELEHLAQPSVDGDLHLGGDALDHKLSAQRLDDCRLACEEVGERDELEGDESYLKEVVDLAEQVVGTPLIHEARLTLNHPSHIFHPLRPLRYRSLDWHLRWSPELCDE